jgi:hypothetical protein
VGSNEIEALFEPGTPGHFSWPQRLRGLREKGYIIDRRIRKGTKNLSEWHLDMGYASNNDRQNAPEAQGCTNTPELGKGVFQAPKPPEGLETQNSGPVYFEKEGQLSFLGGV